jgi:protein-tyrosine phosphatase
MARVGAQDGIAVVCATPHIRHDHDVRIEELPARVAELQRELDRRGIAVRIATGGEVSQLAAHTLDAEQLKAVSLDGGCWILLEPAPGALGEELPELIDTLAARGARVVLAHPERHAGADFERCLRELVQRGALIQWTADFIARWTPHDSTSLIPQLAREGLVHLLASDAHSSHGGRPLRLSAGFARLAQLCSSEQVEWVARTAPAAVLAGEPVTPPL